MKIPDRYLEQIVIALEHHAAYLNATRRDGRPYEEIVRELQEQNGRSARVPQTPSMKCGERRKRSR